MMTAPSSMRSTISKLPLPARLLVDALTADARTPSPSQFRTDTPVNSPSIQRRARLLANDAHYSFVTPFPSSFPYAIEPPESGTSDPLYVEKWLAAREPRIANSNEPLTKYTRDRPGKTVLLGVAENALADCVPGLDVGDAFSVIGKPTLLPGTKEHPSSSPNDARDDLVDVLSGQAVLMSDSFAPWALRYSGHQFGSWAGQLGDGRAVTILATPHPTNPDMVYELQLKGSGRTPFSRSADGLAVTRSSVREYLCSEAMHALGIPTTRALALVSLPDIRVERETTESACILTRVAPSFIRIGSFEALNPPQNIFLFGGGQQPANLEALRILGEWVAGPVLRLPDFDGKKPWGKALLFEVARRNARMTAGWQAYGWMHGVINTDNVSVLGLTIDFGPFAFMDAHDPWHICNHTDEEGRYAYRSQPAAILFALRALHAALAPLIGAEEELKKPVAAGWAEGIDKQKIEEWREAGDEAAKDELDRIAQSEMAEEYGRLMRKRLSLRRAEPTDEVKVVRALLDVMASHKLDFNATFRVLTDFHPTLLPASSSSGPNLALDAFIERLLAQVPTPSSLDRPRATQELRGWLDVYARRIEREADLWATDVPMDVQRKKEGRASNPRFVLRQWVLQEVIAAVEKDPIRGRIILAKTMAMASKPFEPWGGEDAKESEVGALSVEEQEERRFCGFGEQKMLGFQCSCSS
ncbi:hypothetical protein MKEN_00340000 [Mycena kentingensis (nom. inval.)]|nr:hypothetical protein MKEN_00340000 [Mycena kentingensis (nom. inval.)]